MIVPARWYAGGKGLDYFREEMLHDNRIRVIHDFPEANDFSREFRLRVVYAISFGIEKIKENVP
jgi:hypothetical protein